MIISWAWYERKDNNYVVDYLTTSQRVVNEILRLPEDDTCMLIARGDDFHPFVGDANADSANAIFFSRSERIFRRRSSHQPAEKMDIPFLEKLTLDNGGKVLRFGDLNLQDYESMKDRYELDEFGKGKYPFSNVPPTNYGVKATMRHGDGNKEIEMVAPNEILPGDYICRVNDFEVNLETTQEEIFSIIRNTLLSVNGTLGKRRRKQK